MSSQVLYFNHNWTFSYLPYFEKDLGRKLYKEMNRCIDNNEVMDVTDVWEGYPLEYVMDPSKVDEYGGYYIDILLGDKVLGTARVREYRSRNPMPFIDRFLLNVTPNFANWIQKADLGFITPDGEWESGERTDPNDYIDEQELEELKDASVTYQTGSGPRIFDFDLKAIGQQMFDSDSSLNDFIANMEEYYDLLVNIEDYDFDEDEQEKVYEKRQVDIEDLNHKDLYDSRIQDEFYFGGFDDDNIDDDDDENENAPWHTSGGKGDDNDAWRGGIHNSYFGDEMSSKKGEGGFVPTGAMFFAGSVNFNYKFWPHFERNVLERYKKVFIEAIIDDEDAYIEDDFEGHEIIYSYKTGNREKVKATHGEREYVYKFYIDVWIDGKKIGKVYHWDNRISDDDIEDMKTSFLDDSAGIDEWVKQFDFEDVRKMLEGIKKAQEEIRAKMEEERPYEEMDNIECFVYHYNNELFQNLVSLMKHCFETGKPDSIIDDFEGFEFEYRFDPNLIQGHLVKLEIYLDGKQVGGDGIKAEWLKEYLEKDPERIKNSLIVGTLHNFKVGVIGRLGEEYAQEYKAQNPHSMRDYGIKFLNEEKLKNYREKYGYDPAIEPKLKGKYSSNDFDPYSDEVLDLHNKIHGDWDTKDMNSLNDIEDLSLWEKIADDFDEI